MNPLVRLPRMPLGTLPTPLRPAPALSAARPPVTC